MVLRGLAAVTATPAGFRLSPARGRGVAVLAPPLEDGAALAVTIRALIQDGAAWSTGALAQAAGVSQRTLQRTLRELAARGAVRRARRRSDAPLGRRADHGIRDNLVAPRRAGDELIHRRRDAMTRAAKSATPAEPVEIVREYGPLPGIAHVAGVTFDGQQVWIASGDRLNALDPDSGAIVRSIDVPADAGTAFDGRHLWQLAGGRIRQIDAATGQVLKTLAPAIEGNPSGMAWAEGTLVGRRLRGRQDPSDRSRSGAVLRAIESDRFVTGVSWIDGELWHGDRLWPERTRRGAPDRSALRRRRGSPGLPRRCRRSAASKA